MVSSASWTRLALAAMPAEARWLIAVSVSATTASGQQGRSFVAAAGGLP